jgi:hypothetical protein
LPDSSHFDQIQPASDHGWIPASFGGNLVRRNSATVTGFQRRTLAGFRQSDIKRACKNEEFNFEKRFIVFKTVNRFPKIKETFTVKLKMIFVGHYFCPYQTP